jgi:mono/diheme cytochrome c family protein
MRPISRWPTIVLAALVLAGGSATRVAAQRHDDHKDQAKPGTKHEAGAHTHAAAAKIKNPVKPSPQSVAAGGKLFQARCANCHGTGGLGDGQEGAKMTPKPSNLADASWKHGPSDGEIFTVIRDGTKADDKPAMPGFASKMSEQEIWNTVNYIRSLLKK